MTSPKIHLAAKYEGCVVEYTSLGVVHIRGPLTSLRSFQEWVFFTLGIDLPLVLDHLVDGKPLPGFPRLEIS